MISLFEFRVWVGFPIGADGNPTIMLIFLDLSER